MYIHMSLFKKIYQMGKREPIKTLRTTVNFMKLSSVPL